MDNARNPAVLEGLPVKDMCLHHTVISQDIFLDMIGDANITSVIPSFEIIPQKNDSPIQGHQSNVN